MTSWLDGFYENMWLKLVRYNSSTSTFQAGGITVPNVRAVDDWTALQAIPKTSANNELVVYVRDQPANKSLWIYKHSTGRWKTVDTTFGPHAKSIMYIGDYPSILLGNSTTGVMYLQDSRVPYYYDVVTMSTVNSAGSYIRHYRFNRGCTKTSGGSLKFTKSTRTLEWKAPGDTGYGTAVNVSRPGWYRLESFTTGMDMCCSIYPLNEPATDATDAITLAGLTNATISRHGLASPVGHFNALYGNPFREKQYPFLGTFMRAVDLRDSYPDWQDIDSDITLIWFHLTGSNTSIAEMNTGIDYLMDVVQRRKDRGSHVIVMTLLEANGYSDASMGFNTHAIQRLMQNASSIGYEIVDVNSILRNPAGTLSDPLTATNLSTDLFMPSSRGAYLIAKNVLYPVLSKYLPSITQKTNPAIPYSTTNPHGNLLTNGRFTGVSGTKGSGCTGDIADSWTCGRTSGSTVAVVGTMPDSGSPIARTDGLPGKWARFVISGATAADVITITQTSNISTSNYTTGDVVQLEGTLRLSGVSAMRAINVRLTTDKGHSIVMGDNSSTTNYLIDDLNGESPVYYLSSMPMIIASGTTVLNVHIVLTFGASGAATLDLGQDFIVRKLT